VSEKSKRQNIMKKKKEQSSSKGLEFSNDVKIKTRRTFHCRTSRRRARLAEGRAWGVGEPRQCQG